MFVPLDGRPVRLNLAFIVLLLFICHHFLSISEVLDDFGEGLLDPFLLASDLLA